jgi:hypothetical protein
VAVFAKALFTGTDWQHVTTLSPTMGGPIRDHPSDDGNWYVYQNRALCRTPGLCYLEGMPSSANYSVTADIIVKSSIGSTGVAGRISTTDKTYYAAYIEQATNKLVLIKWVNGTLTRLGSVSASSYGIGTHTLTLDMNGTTIRALIGGVEILNQTDSSITAPGKAGFRAPVISDTTTGKHLDNFVATDGSAAASPRSYVVGLIGL